MERDMVVVGVAHDTNVAKVVVLDVPDKPGVAYRIFSALAAENINVDMIVQTTKQENTTDLLFTVTRDDLAKTLEVTRDVAGDLGAAGVLHATGLGKVSIVGAGMVSNPGVAARMFEALARARHQHSSHQHVGDQSVLLDRPRFRARRRAGDSRSVCAGRSAGRDGHRRRLAPGDQRGRRGPGLRMGERHGGGPGGNGAWTNLHRQVHVPAGQHVHIQRGRTLGQTGHGHDVTGQTDEKARAHVGPNGAHRQRPSFGRAL